MCVIYCLIERLLVLCEELFIVLLTFEEINNQETVAQFEAVFLKKTEGNLVITKRGTSVGLRLHLYIFLMNSNNCI